MEIFEVLSRTEMDCVITLWMKGVEVEVERRFARDERVETTVSRLAQLYI